MLPNPPRQQQWPVLAASSRPIMIECSRLKKASVVAVERLEVTLQLM